MGGFSTLGLSWEQVKQKLENEGAKNKQYDSDIDGVLDLGAIPTITRDKLEYPTEDVSFTYLQAIGKVTYANTNILLGAGNNNRITQLTVDSFTDKAIRMGLGQARHLVARATNYDTANYRYDLYTTQWWSGYSTADVELYKVVNGTATSLATESVDLDENYLWILELVCSGSTIKVKRMRDDSYVEATISATDTDLASGQFGVGSGDPNENVSDYGVAKLLAPSTPLPKPKAIVEIDSLKQNLKEIMSLDGLPDFLYREAKKYELLKQKGFTDDEIKELFGNIQTHVDLASVTWGAFDHKPEHNTMLITITGGNAYTGEKAITEQIEHTKSKNLKVLKPPRDYSEAIEQYRQLKQEFTEWIAGKENYIYQCGFDVEPLACADFYYGELIEHKTHYKQLKRVPEWELERTIKRWRDLHKYAKAPKEEIEKHVKKLDEILRVGW